MALLDRVLGDVHGLAIADVACGTGRASRHLASRGARVTGLDFAPKTLEIARREAAEQGLAIDFRLHDALGALPGDLAGRFDVGVTISCLAMACSEPAVFDRALAEMVKLIKPEGRFFFLEPIHTSRLLRRILKMSTSEWIRRSEARGLELLDRGRMGFVPARLTLAFREWPEGLVRPVFWAGERLLDRAPALDPLSDYKWLLFRRRVDG
jgi:SAM-dependent methyltransferase